MSKIVYIAEKPSVGKAIAAVVGAKTQKNNYLETSDGEIVVTWVFGHILELVDAESYDEKFAKWNLDDLPIIPNEFIMRPPIDRPKQGVDNKYRRNQFELIKKLISTTQEVCIATDPDAEGELLGIEVLDYINYTGKCTRILPTSLDEKTIKAALSAKKNASETRPLYMGGMARRDIDWTVGINITRALTTYNRHMIDSPLNAGRVQTFIVGLIYERDVTIKNFKPMDTYNLEFKASSKPSFNLKWQKGKLSNIFDASSEGYDSQLAKDTIERISKLVAADKMVVTSCSKERKKTPPKLGFSLTDLQIECSKKLGLTGAETLAITQKLYEAKLVTYPRSDCRYMPKSQHSEASRVLDACVTAAGNVDPELIDTKRVSKAWNDSKIENHHAIIPTHVKPKSDLQTKMFEVYSVIAKRYVSQFLPDYEYDSTIIEATSASETFKATGNVPVIQGWKSLNNESDEAESDNTSDNGTLPILNKGDVVDGDCLVKVGKTTPPKPFTEETLLSTLVSAYKLVQDDVLAKNLKEREKGIGTVATTANIIAQLTANKFITVKKKRYEVTKKGSLMAQIAPRFLLNADTTALLDYKLASIEKGEDNYDNVVSDYKSKVAAMVDDIKKGKSALPTPLLPSESCPYCHDGLTIRRKSKTGFFWKCVNCEEIATDNFGQPEKRVIYKKIECKKCSRPLLTRYPIKDSRDGLFTWYCTGCKVRANDVNGSPDYTEQKCHKCNSLVQKLFSKRNQSFFWVCSNKESCGQIFNDENNNPVLPKPNFEDTKEPCPSCKAGTVLKRKGEHGDFYSCSNWSRDGKGCTAKIVKSEAGFIIKQAPKGLPCPSCKKGTITKKNGKYGDFWSCSNWNKKGKLKCDYRASDKNGKPEDVK